jgi:phosphoglycolate phosphatase-like HAD superfamily hydrolase
MKVLALDFDGVIADSAPEAFAVALQTYADVFPDGGLGPQQEDPEASLFARFLELMPLGNRAEDYAVCLRAIDTGTRIADQAAYDAFRAALDRVELRAFHKRFYRVRAAWARRDPQGWRAGMRCYPGVADLLRRRAGDVRLAIATAKDRRSVRDLLEGYGIAELFPEGFVMDKETGVSKRAHVERLVEITGCGLEEVTFVDDKVNHLKDVAGLGSRCLLAAWGYNGAREQHIAREAGIGVCGLEDFEALLFG